MILHPLVLGIVVVDAAGALLLVWAAIGALGSSLDWSPGASGPEQLRRERLAERVSLQGRLATAALVFASLLLVVGVAAVLPGLVPGAMCGQGVLEASSGALTRALVFRGLAVAALAAWHLVDRLDRTAPRAPLALPSARAMLLATPLGLLAAWSTAQGLLSLDVHRPVDCCSTLYQSTGALVGVPSVALGHGGWVATLGLGALALVVLALWSRRTGRGVVPLALGSLVWAAVAGHALVRVLVAYHYGVLAHHCAWCLLLPEHLGVGWPLYGALAVVALEGPAAGLATALARRTPEVVAPAAARARTAALRVAVAAGIFAAVALGPALAWRLQYGVWMG